MDFQKMSTEAQKTILDFSTSQHSTLQLYIKDGLVCSRICPSHAQSCPTRLNIAVWYQTHGFTHTEWNEIITELLNLYNKEKACQNQQKP